MRACICGPRDLAGYDPFTVRSTIRMVLLGLQQRHGEIVLVNGCARGVDQWAADIATDLGIPVEPYPIPPGDWKRVGKMAGHQRNQRMVDSGLDLVVGIKHPFNWDLDRGGTEDMVRRSRDAKVPTLVIQPLVLL